MLAAVFVVLVLAGGYATGTTYAAPGTTTERQTVEHWAVSGDFQHSATVTRANPVFDEGTTLTGRSTYFAGATPVLDGTYTVSYADAAGSGAEPVDVAATAALVLQSASDGEVFWTDSERLAATAESLADGEATTLSFSLNATRVDQRATDIQQSLGDTGGDISATIAVTVNATGSVAGTERGVATTHTIPLTLDGSTYSVGEAATTREAATTTRTVERTQSYGPPRTVGGPFLLATGIAGLGALAALRRRDALGLTGTEREYLEFREDRAEFDEWVVRARLPPAVRERAQADAESLADLVDYAIDAEVGVVEDTETRPFYAVTREVVVVFDPPAEPDAASPFDGDERADTTPLAALSEAVGRATDTDDGAAAAHDDEADSTGPAREPTTDGPAIPPADTHRSTATSEQADEPDGLAEDTDDAPPVESED